MVYSLREQGSNGKTRRRDFFFLPFLVACRPAKIPQINRIPIPQSHSVLPFDFTFLVSYAEVVSKNTARKCRSILIANRSNQQVDTSFHGYGGRRGEADGERVGDVGWMGAGVGWGGFRAKKKQIV